ncbi:MAG TPA: hypothetical protein VIK75_00515, partial [Calditerricola sp.]
LFRMDEGKRAEIETKLVGGMIKTPDESRAKFGLAPTAGGNTLWGQHQDYPLGTLANRLPPDQNPQAPEQAAPTADEGTAREEERAMVAAAIAQLARQSLKKRKAANAA